MLEDKKQELTPVSALGEFGLIEHLTRHFDIKNDHTRLGIGDDAASVHTESQHTVISTDLLCEGVHFNLGYVPLKHLGYKSIAVNLSDIAAMNARPAQVLVSIAASNRFPVEAFDEIYEGMYLCCKRYGIELIGGDTSSSQSGLVISVTAIGYADEITKRSGAEVRDLLVVTGDLGAAYMGLQVLEREHSVYLANPEMQPEMEGYDYLLERQLKPEPRVDIRAVLEQLEVQPTAMIDISDGLASEVLHLSEKSGVDFRLYENKIPLDPLTVTTAEEFNLSPITAAMNGGEDYELLFTIRPGDFEKIRNHPDFSVIGHVVEKGMGNTLVLSGSEQEVAITAQGWNAFQS